MKGLNELRDKIHKNAKEKGFYDDETSIINFGVGTKAESAIRIALIHSELSEALEADRIGKQAELLEFERVYNHLRNESSEKSAFTVSFGANIKNTVEDELADVIIRVLDLCGYLGVDIEKHVELKMKYNSNREYKHGKQY